MSSNSEDSCDDDLQVELLQQLEQYACGRLGETPPKINSLSKSNKKKELKSTSGITNQVEIETAEKSHKRTRKRKRPSANDDVTRVTKSTTVEILNGESVNCCESKSKVKTKKKKKRQKDSPAKIERELSDVELDDDLEDDTMSDVLNEIDCAPRSLYLGTPGTETGSKHLEDIKDMLGLTESDFLDYKAKKQVNEDTTTHLVKNKFGVKKRAPPELVVFTEHKKKQRGPSSSQDDDASINLSKAKWDVRRFGTTGLSGKNKDDSTLEMLVRLGAKLPKAKPVKFRDGLEKKRLEKLDREQMLDERQKYGDTGMVLGEPLKKKKRVRSKKDKNAIRGSFGSIGKERHGAQIISQRDVRRINKSRR